MSRFVIAYAVSAVVHVGALTLAWLCGAAMLMNFEPPEFEAVRGEALTLVASLSRQAEPTRTVELVMPEPSQANRAVEPAQPQPRRVLIAKSDFKLPDQTPHPSETLPSDSATPPANFPDRSAQAALEKLPELELSAAKPPPPRKAPVMVEVAQHLVAAAVEGAKLDRLPRKLPNNRPPVYPESARVAGQQGRVILQVAIDAAGRVEQANVHRSSGFPALDAAALDAVREWQFQPAAVSGQAVRSKVNVPLNFILRR